MGSEFKRLSGVDPTYDLMKSFVDRKDAEKISINWNEVCVSHVRRWRRLVTEVLNLGVNATLAESPQVRPVCSNVYWR